MLQGVAANDHRMPPDSGGKAQPAWAGLYSLSNQQMIKEKKAIFGVIETWWDQLKDGDKIEIWNYTQKKGTFSVYFLNDSGKVWHTSFVGKNVRF
jgi:hypothetical protein